MNTEERNEIFALIDLLLIQANEALKAAENETFNGQRPTNNIFTNN